MTFVEKLSTGYWHVRWNANQWIQWPVGELPQLEHGFGWLTTWHFNEAARLTANLDKDHTQ